MGERTGDDRGEEGRGEEEGRQVDEGEEEDVDIGGDIESMSSGDDDDDSSESSSRDGDDDDDMLELEDVLATEGARGGQGGDGDDDDDPQILRARIQSLEDELYHEDVPEGQRAHSFSKVRGHSSSSRNSTQRTSSGGVMGPPRHLGEGSSRKDPPVDKGNVG
ncbi:uncharacterized protein LOC131069463 [Cryptomeria japonica]|uniref:uncharacterized protein LOC131069463 n=1 Tax=Cryptomeria japonica TaxID=3369 RepID=UPI0027DAA860|nr:uncharacterized protein LOC131069463 [Cryptomeria japonica]